MKPRTVWTAIVFGAVVLFAVPLHAEMIRKESALPFADTVERLEATIKDRGLTQFAKIDHAAGAKQVGQELRPTMLIIFGSPAVGTPLIQAQQTMGLALPLKALVWQDAGGKVWIGYDAPADMAKERGIAADHPIIQKISGALGAISDATTRR
jgi:uncharacterized protein (DUF302 family)